MSNSTLISIIRSLNNKERQELKQFIKKDKNKDDKTTQLLTSLLKHHTKENTILMPIIFNKIYPKDNYNENKLRVLMSRLLKLVEEYLVFLNIKKKKESFRSNLLEVYHNKNIDNTFINLFRKDTTSQSRSTSTYEDIAYQKFCQNKLMYFHEVAQKKDVGATLNKMTHLFQHYEALEHLRIICYILSVDGNINEVITPYSTVTLDLLNNGAFQEDITIQSYYLSYQFYINPDGQQFYTELKTLIQESKDNYSFHDLKTLTFLLLNYSIGQLNKGQQEFLAETFSIYQLGLDNQTLLSESGKLSRWTFQNIVSAGLLLDKIKWTEQFLHHYKEQVEVKNQQTVYLYNLSKLFYKKKDYSAAILHLQKIDSRNKSDLEILNAKSLLLRIYFEEEEWDSLDSLLASFERYLNRQKKIGYHKKAFLHLIQYTKRLIRMQHSSIAQLKQLKSNINQISEFADKRWILEQIDKLILK